MKFLEFRRWFFIMTFIAVSVAAVAEKSKMAEVKVNVSPSEAYIFVDGQPFTHRSHELKLTPGEHTIGVYNYGFVPQVQKVTLQPGDNPEINARLTEIPEMVKGPWGRIQIEGNHNDKAAVFLNGTTPDFFVGHIDEMNNNTIGEQALIVPVGTYTLILVNPKETTPFFTGQVEVKENQRVIVDVAAKENTREYKPWTRGEDHPPYKRFEAGSRTANIAVAPVTASIALDKNQINCGQFVQLTWNSKEAPQVIITANGKQIADSPLTGGTLKLQPLETTKYELRAVGPGGIVNTDTSVDVNTAVKTSLTVSANDVNYHKVGTQVTEQGSATLTWSASNADSVRIDPIGQMTGTSGTEPVTFVPTQTANGPVDETKTYTITATNICGGSDTQTARVHLTGAIEPEVVAEAKLPQTASPLPLLGLLGFGSVLTGLGIRSFRKRR